MNLYYVDCFDSEHWVLASTEDSARSIAAEKSGHTDCNECLRWFNTLWGSRIKNQERAVEELITAGWEISKEIA